MCETVLTTADIDRILAEVQERRFLCPMGSVCDWVATVPDGILDEPSFVEYGLEGVSDSLARMEREI